MLYKEPTADVGVIIGRFQVAELHLGHQRLIDSVRGKHKKVIILLGVAPTANSINNPLDFESRKQMLMRAYPSITVLYVKDVGNDMHWSRAVDQVVSDVLTPNQTVLLYGSRDSFITSYLGKFNTYELPTEHAQSGTEVRAEIAREAKDSADWRAGVIWASKNRWPVSYQAVDIAIFNMDYTQMLLGHKPNEDFWRLPGGFADPCSDSLEADARREALEETGIKLRDVTYVRSFRIDDWRYRSGPDCIKTALFISRTADMNAVANDDIDRVLWFDIESLNPTYASSVVPEHLPLITSALMKARTYREGGSQKTH